MYIVSVVPLVKLPPSASDLLDYFCSELLVRGSLVRISIGRRVVMGLVIDARDLRSAKLSIKKSDFSLKGIHSIVARQPQLTPHQLLLADWIAAQYACSRATALQSIAPSWIGKRGSILDHDTASIESSRSSPPELHIVDPTATYHIIKSRCDSADGQCCVLVADRAVAEVLKHQCLPHAVVYHSGLSIKEQRAIYQGVLHGTISTVIGTRSVLTLPWKRLRHLIVEDPLNELYKSDMAPRTNGPDVARQLATLHGATLTWLSAALSTVQYHLMQTKLLTVINHRTSWPHITLTRTEDEVKAGHQALFCRRAQDAIVECFERKQPLLVFSARKGYSMMARCRRCNATIQCANCSLPLRWHRTSEQLLVCYHCAAFQAVPRQCPTCHAGTLEPWGAPGSQKLATALSVILDRYGHSGINIPILDSDLTLETTDVTRTLAQLDASPHPFLVASSMILNHRYTRSFSTIIVPSLDLLTTSADYRTHDRLILTLEKLVDFQPNHIILQTYGDDTLEPYIEQRRWYEYFTQELALRKQLRWPPYSRVIKLTFAHRDRAASQRAATAGADRLARAIAHLKARGTTIVGPTPAFIEKSAGTWRYTLILKSTLPASRIKELISYLPPGWQADVDPRTIS